MKNLSPSLRRVGLTAHIVLSVGWLGAVLVFLALGIMGLSSQDALVVRGVYRLMDPAARFALVPLAVTSLFSGIVQSWATPWGLFRHYWVLAKLVLTAFATVILLVYLKTFATMARLAAEGSDLSVVRNPSPLLHAVLAAGVLLATTILGVYKPKGVLKGAQADPEREV